MQIASDKTGHGSLATNRERKSLVIDTELTTLKPGEAYLRLSAYPPAKVTVNPPQDMAVIAPGFVPVPPTIGQTVTIGALTPALAPAQRIEDRDDWLSLGDA